MAPESMMRRNADAPCERNAVGICTYERTYGRTYVRRPQPTVRDITHPPLRARSRAGFLALVIGFASLTGCSAKSSPPTTPNKDATSNPIGNLGGEFFESDVHVGARTVRCVVYRHNPYPGNDQFEHVAMSCDWSAR